MNKFYEMCRDFLRGEQSVVIPSYFYGNLAVFVTKRDDKFFIETADGFSLYIIEKNKQYFSLENRNLSTIFANCF